MTEAAVSVSSMVDTSLIANIVDCMIQVSRQLHPNHTLPVKVSIEIIKSMKSLACMYAGACN